MEITIKEESPLPVQHRFGKLMFGTAAGFIATALMESMYESIMNRATTKAKSSPKNI